MGISQTIGRLTGKRQLVVAFLAGAFMGLAQAPWSLPYVYFLAIPVLFWLHGGAMSARRAALLGWIAGLAYFGLTLSWLVEPFLVHAASQGWMAPFALFFMAAGLSVFWAGAFALARPGNVPAFAAFWTLAELLRATVFTGFPWGLIAYAWVDTPLVQGASGIGVHGLGLLTVLGTVWLAGVLNRRWWQASAGVAIFALLWGWGAYRLAQPVLDRGVPFVVRIVQPNAAQDLKWLPEFMSVFFERQLTLSGEGEMRPDLVIWPEAAVPFIPSQRPDLLQQMAEAAKGAQIVFGARRVDEQYRWYNGLFVLDAAGNISAQYDKHHLAPFGEYIPLSDVIAKTGIDWLVGLTGTGFTAGEGVAILEPAGIPAFLPLICYEAIFPQDARIAGQRPEWLLQVTNDAWFGKFSGPYQHLAQARVRAIEQGLPLARAANTGVSAMIGPYGRIRAMLAMGVSGRVDAILPAPLKPTIYSRTGDWGILGVVLALTIYQYYLGRRQELGNFPEKRR